MPPIARFMGATWGPSGADRTQVGPMLAPWTLLSGALPAHQNTQNTRSEIYRGTQSSNTLLFFHGLLFNTGSSYPYVSGLLHWHEQSYKIGTKFEEYICVNEFPNRTASGMTTTTTTTTTATTTTIPNPYSFGCTVYNGTEWKCFPHHWPFARGIHWTPVDSPHKRPGPCITNVIATCRKNFSQWERSFLWKLRCHWLKFLRCVAKTLVIQGPEMPSF